MKSKEANLFQLITVAQALGDLLPHVTFVGGRDRNMARA
jgi:hypothetical protein